MCGPAAVPLAIAAAGAAASAGGSYMNAKAENKRTNAGYKASRNQAEAERIRQRAFQQQGDEVMRQAVPAATSPQTLADAIGMREAGVQQVVQPTRNEYAPTPQSTPNVVNSEIDRQSNKSVAKVGRNAQAQGRLLAFGDADSARGRTMNRSGDHLAIGDFMGASDIDDLVDYVCDEYAEPPAPPPPAAPVVTDAMVEAGYRILWSSGDRIYPEVFAAMRRLLTAALEAK